MTTRRTSKIPLDFGKHDPRFLEWMKQNMEQRIPLTKLHDVVIVNQHDGADTVTTEKTTYRVRHMLGHIPAGFTVLRMDKAAIVYQAKNPDKHFVYLKSDTDAVTVTIEVS